MAIHVSGMPDIELLWMPSLFPCGSHSQLLGGHYERWHLGSKRTAVEPQSKAGSQTRLNSSGRLFFKPLAIFSMFTNDTFLIPRSTPL